MIQDIRDHADITHDKITHDIYNSRSEVVTLNHPYEYTKKQYHICYRGWSRVTMYPIQQVIYTMQGGFLNE